MDERKGVYRVLKSLYESDLEEENPGEHIVKSICEEERYKKGDSMLERVGKRQRIYRIIHRLNILNQSTLAEEAEREEVNADELKEIISELKSRGLIYEPEPGVFGFIED